MLRVEDIAIRFARPGHDVYAVRGVSFELREKSTLTLLGESASGKSALLRSLTGLLPGYAKVTGRMAVGGTQLAEYRAADVARLRGSFFAMVFQEPATAFDPLFTIGEQLAEAIVAREGIQRKQARERAHDLLAMGAIPAPARRLGNYPHELSGGMLQRAMIAIALASQPADISPRFLFCGRVGPATGCPSPAAYVSGGSGEGRRFATICGNSVGRPGGAAGRRESGCCGMSDGRCGEVGFLEEPV